ncbi:MAG: flagellar biosynthetic protein FliR [Spirochaetales bacterium]|nr:flagellar biosynthetic protein FliR [Spirochaetales bacterium]
MEGFNQSTLLFALIMARVTGLLFTMPVLSAESVPYRVRTGLAFFLSIAMFPVTASYLPAPAATPLGMGLLVIGQAMMGIITGLLMQMVFAAFQIAGEIFSIQVGLSFSEVLDPQSQVSIPILGTLKNLVGILLFVSVPFTMDGIYTTAMLHSFRALVHSFKAVAFFNVDAGISGGVLAELDQAFGILFITALKIAIPLMGILFLSSLALGILGRAAPQMNLMVMGIQVNILTGIILLVVLMPVMVPLMLDAFQVFYGELGEMLRIWPR